MSSVRDKRTSREYSFRPAVNPGQSFQEFISQIPDAAINPATKKHSEFKKPYLNSSYQEMDYNWDPPIVPPIDYPPITPPWIPDFPIPIPPIPGDGPYPVPQPPPYPPRKPGDRPRTPPINIPKYPPRKPGDGPVYPIPKPPATKDPPPHPGDEPHYPISNPPKYPAYPVPKLSGKAPTYPLPKPGDEPPQTSPSVWDFKKCCQDVYLGKGETNSDGSTLIVYGSSSKNGCSYEVRASDGYFDLGGGMQSNVGLRFSSGEGGTTTFSGSTEATTITIGPSGGGVPCKKITIPGTANCTTIGYTSQQMSLNEEQAFTATGEGGSACSGCAFAVGSGGGSITPEGVYTAPSSNANCADNPEINLVCNGVVVDTVTIAINNPSVSGHAAVVKTCSQGSGNNGCGCFGVYGEVYGCAGDLLHVCGSPGSVLNTGPPPYTYDNCDDAFAAVCVNAYAGQCDSCASALAFCTDYDGGTGTTDLRTPDMESSGCCPAQLL